MAVKKHRWLTIVSRQLFIDSTVTVVKLNPLDLKTSPNGRLLIMIVKCIERLYEVLKILYVSDKTLSTKFVYDLIM